MLLIRSRLLTAIAIGVITSTLSLVALVRVLTVTAGQRRERAEEAVQKELDRLVAAGPDELVSALSAPPALGMIGLRGGVWDKKSTMVLPKEWHAPLAALLQKSASEGQRFLDVQPLGTGLLVIATAPLTDEKSLVAWAGYFVPPPHYWRFWLTIVILLAVATALLFTIAVWAVVSFYRSALEQERLGRELAQQERLAALGRVVAGVAHEVRNPLASIKLRLDLATAGAALPPAVTQAISHASAEITRLDRLVADLLVIAGRQIGPRTPTSLGALVRFRTDALAPWAALRGVHFRASGDAWLAIDADKVGRAIDNLLRNAVEASPPNAEVAVQIYEQRETFVVSVEDHGPGVQNSAELFEPFFTTKSDGTGLGLAISRAIARAHGGDVTYARPGPITCFALTLAKRAAPSVNTREAAA